MKKMLLLLCFASAVLTCTTTPPDNSRREEQARRLEETRLRDLNEAIVYGTAEIATGLPEGAKVAVLNVAGAPTEALANYMLNEIVDALVNTGKFTLLDRDKTNKAMINSEIGYQQVTGEVNEDNQVRIGENLGAEIIITCMLEDIGEYYRLRLRSLEIQGRKMMAAKSVNMRSADRMLSRALTLAAQIPGKPEMPALDYSRTGFSNTRYLNINWKKVPKATAYYVYISENPTQPTNPTLTEKRNSCKVEVREKRRQYVWVRAANSSGSSPVSEMAISNPNY
ncbi:hypothetical protein AGMMS49942_02320 [Spirochaetia bacterium]|nr:hypothetical protein AGMMS49942_02320 [Spirochaetia bacterium]